MANIASLRSKIVKLTPLCLISIFGLSSQALADHELASSRHYESGHYDSNHALERKARKLARTAHRFSSQLHNLSHHHFVPPALIRSSDKFSRRADKFAHRLQDDGLSPHSIEKHLRKLNKNAYVVRNLLNTTARLPHRIENQWASVEDRLSSLNYRKRYDYRPRKIDYGYNKHYHDGVVCHTRHYPHSEYRSPKPHYGGHGHHPRRPHYKKTNVHIHHQGPSLPKVHPIRRIKSKLRNLLAHKARHY